MFYLASFYPVLSAVTLNIKVQCNVLNLSEFESRIRLALADPFVSSFLLADFQTVVWLSHRTGLRFRWAHNTYMVKTLNILLGWICGFFQNGETIRKSIPFGFSASEPKPVI